MLVGSREAYRADILVNNTIRSRYFFHISWNFYLAGGSIFECDVDWVDAGYVVLAGIVAASC